EKPVDLRATTSLTASDSGSGTTGTAVTVLLDEGGSGIVSRSSASRVVIVSAILLPEVRVPIAILIRSSRGSGESARGFGLRCGRFWRTPPFGARERQLDGPKRWPNVGLFW